MLEVLRIRMRNQWGASLAQSILRSVLVSAMVSCLYVLSCSFEVSQRLITLLFDAWGIFVLFATAIVFYVLISGVATVLHIWKVNKKSLVDSAVFLCVFTAFTAVALITEEAMRTDRIRRIINEVEPLISGIDKYEADHGRLPDSLPKLQRPNGQPILDLKIRLLNVRGRKFGENTWVLFVPLPIRGLTHESLLYFPNKWSPENNSQFSVKRIGEWVLIVGSVYYIDQSS